MADADKEHSTAIQFPVPPPSKKPRTCLETIYSKCIICQLDRDEKLRKAQESSIANFISKLKIREDDVQKRLATDLEKLQEHDVLWHSTCYASYTSPENLKYVRQISTEDNVQHQRGRMSRSTVSVTDWSKCLFCKNRTYKKNPQLHRVSTQEACNKMLDAANSKGDEEMLHVLRGVNNDLIAAKAKYHKVCHSSYVAKKNIEHQTLKLEASEVSPYQEQAEASEVSPYQEKARSFSLEDVVKDGESCVSDKAQKADGTNLLVQSNENPIYQIAKMIKADIKKCQGISLHPLNVNDITLTKAKEIVPSSLYWFLRWLIENKRFEQKDEPESCPNDADERKILSLAQDVIHCTSHGQVWPCQFVT